MGSSKLSSETERIVFLDYLRVFAMFLVFGVHASESVYSDGTLNFLFKNETDRLSVSFMSSFSRYGVDLYVMASAFLLLPLKTDSKTFFKRRFTRVVIPFVFWLLMYAFLPCLWGACDVAQLKDYLVQLCVNTIPPANHLWFIYMLIGLYMLMPILSPWLKQVSRGGEECFLLVWLLTTVISFIHDRFGYMYGEMPGYPYGMFYYFSGFIGFLVLAHYIRNYVNWSMKKTLIISIPLFLAGYAMCVYSFYNRSFYVDCVEDLEHGWDNTGMATVMMAIGAFMLIKKITYSKGFPICLLLRISISSSTVGYPIFTQIINRSNCDSGSIWVPAEPSGFSVAITTKGFPISLVIPSTVICLSSITSNNADWVLGDVLFISSAKNILHISAPGL